MPEGATVWKESFRVRAYETDPGGNASIVSVCNYLQEVAGNHAGRLGVSIHDLEAHDLTWVLARLSVEMDAYPGWSDEVIVETWPSGVDRLFATREFLIMNATGSTLGRASSAWLMIDRSRRRPIRMPEFITSIRLPDRDPPLDGTADRLPDAGEEALDQHLRVRYSDLDVNGHVNNVRYAEWSVEGVPEEILRDHVVRRLDLHFRAEGNYGESVTVRSTELAHDSNGRSWGHIILSDDRVLARSQTQWVAR